jgi:hypothetical protein
MEELEVRQLQVMGHYHIPIGLWRFAELKLGLELMFPKEVLEEERLQGWHLLAHIYPKEQMIKQELHLRFDLPKEELVVERLLD